MKKVVLASSNPGKLREFNELLQPTGIEVLPQSYFSIPDAAEPHGTFVENALAKARHASRLANLPALADDSGLCVSVLDGAPGVRSARFAADPQGRTLDRPAQDRLNNEKLLALLKGRADRRAHYYSVIVLMQSGEDPQPLIADGAWHGEIQSLPKGQNGFGYDPYFLIPGLGLTAAELDPARKNVLSHRGQALALLLSRFRQGLL